MVVVDVVMAVAMTAVCGSSFFFAAAADADICSFFHFEWGMRKNRMPLLAYLFK